MINTNASAKNLGFNIIYTRKLFSFILILKRLNLIQKFFLIKIKGINYVKIYLYFYKTSRIAYNFKILSTPVKSFFISLKGLKLIAKRSGNSVFLISTSRGLIPHQAAIKLNSGGVITGFLSF